jgi:DNA-binding transcriptional MerR regulator
MKISEAALASGLTADTIRFYEGQRVVPAPDRLANGYRDYSDLHVARLRLAKGVRGLGIPVARVAEIVRLTQDATCKDVRDAMICIVQDVISQIDGQLGRLRETRSQLTTLESGLSHVTPRDTDTSDTRCECARLVAGRMLSG